MRILTNVRLASRNRRIAQIMFFASLGVPLLGLLLINTTVAKPSSSESLLMSTVLPFLVLPLAYVVMLYSIRMTNLWVREPRPETAIQTALKGVSSKNTLYNYIYGPAKHVLIGPQGVFAITTRYQDGEFTVNGSEWKTTKRGSARILSFLRMDSIGNPTADALKAAAHIESLLKNIAPEVKVQPLIVFTDPKGAFVANDPTVPVLHALNRELPNLKDYIRDVEPDPENVLTPEQVEAFEQATIPR